MGSLRENTAHDGAGKTLRMVQYIDHVRAQKRHSDCYQNGIFNKDTV